MLSLQMISGDYITIGDDIVIQVFHDSGDHFQISIDAPREIPIVRGAVREREGGRRPKHLLKQRPKSPSDRIHNAKQLEKYLARKEAAERQESGEK